MDFLSEPQRLLRDGLRLLLQAESDLEIVGEVRGKGLMLGVEFVAMRDNLDQLPELVRWAARNHIRFVIVTHMLPVPPPPPP